MLDDRASQRRIRCAIYTRKSSDEGLDQSFNSLDAQREACAAYVLSQRHEGWELLPELYDDGGFSGGTMNRPGITRLMADVQAGKVDVIVVYKVDRLTRSLADFAKMVEILDAAKASFVSITQAFNTTTSMGRLTLNVLLSFAQFEREVTGERIRDKIAASKKKGIWMGGPLPLGYDVKDRKLVINAAEAAHVRHIFERYLQIGSIDALVADLERDGIVTKRVALSSGTVRGGIAFRSGGLGYLLNNRIYLGEIVHKGKCYQGEHRAIIPQDLWNRVQAVRTDNLRDWKHGRRAQNPSLLSGLVWDWHGRPMYASDAVKAGKRYRYYITHPKKVAQSGAPAIRMPAHDFEEAVVERLRSFLSDTASVASMAGADARDCEQMLERASAAIQALNASPSVVRANLLEWIDRIDVHDGLMRMQIKDGPVLEATIAKVRTGVDVRLHIAPAQREDACSRDEQLLAMLAEAQGVRELMHSHAMSDLASMAGVGLARFKRLLRISYLAPDIIDAALSGTPNGKLTAPKLNIAANIPLCWDQQKAMFGVV